MSAARDVLQVRISEAVWTRQVVNICKAYGLHVAHFRTAKTGRGQWVTSMLGNSGYPDLTIAHKGRVIFAELKSEKGRLRPEQKQWQAALPDFHVWRPSDIEEVKMVLREMVAR